MTRPFDISNPDDSVALDESGRGSTIFTVTNILDKPLVGTLRVHGTDGSKDGWFSVDGSIERRFLPKVGDQVTVSVNVPPGTPVAKYGLRLDALSEVNPNDDLTAGPTVSVKIREAGPPPPPRKWWIWVVVAVVVLVVAVATWLVERKKTVTPDPTTTTTTTSGSGTGGASQAGPREVIILPFRGGTVNRFRGAERVAPEKNEPNKDVRKSQQP